ncbi:MAG: (Fe-S)-binding protein [Bacteroidales bacterium]
MGKDNSHTGLFIPCFVDQLFPHTGFSMLKVLKRADQLRQKHMQFHYNPEQTCCGQAAFNSGYWDEAKHLGEKFIRDFMEYDYVVAPSASCTSMVRNYHTQMFYNSALHNESNYLRRKIFELTDFLVNVMEVEDLEVTFEGRVCFHDACVALREYGLGDQPRQLLRQVRGLELLEMQDQDVCCGFGGAFAVKHEAISTAMAEQKIQHALDSGAGYIVSTESSCLMHLEGYIKKHNIPIQTIHIADLLAKELS